MAINSFILQSPGERLVITPTLLLRKLRISDTKNVAQSQRDVK